MGRAHMIYRRATIRRKHETTRPCMFDVATIVGAHQRQLQPAVLSHGYTSEIEISDQPLKILVIASPFNIKRFAFPRASVSSCPYTIKLFVPTYTIHLKSISIP
jgi:hypothetical protein